MKKKSLILALVIMGFTSLVSQALLIRESLVTFFGNELSIGIILANWIILEAIGSGILGRLLVKQNKPLISYISLQIIISIYLPIAIILIRMAKYIGGANLGEALGLAPIFYLSFLILAPLSLCDGLQFPLGCQLYSDIFRKSKSIAIGKVYIIEAIGFIISGLTFSFLLINRFHSLAIAFIITILNIISALLLIQSLEDKRVFFKKVNIVTISLICTLVMVLFFFKYAEKIHEYSIRQQWKGLKIIEYKNSIYGNIVVTQREGQYTFFSDGIPIITVPNPDIVFQEEFVHFSLLSHPKPKNLLLISGGVGGIINEVLKHSLVSLDYLELDPALISTIKKYPTPLTSHELEAPRVRIKNIDGRFFVKTTKSNYDLAMINLNIPSTLQLNRFYTQEFFSEVKNILKDDGLLTFHLPGSLSYLGKELIGLNLCILNSLKQVFPYTKVIPGDFNLLIASKSPFSLNAQIIVTRLKERQLNLKVLTDFHIRYRLDENWQRWFYDSLNTAATVRLNQDLKPNGLFYALSFWNAKFSPYLKKFFKTIDKINLGVCVIIIAIFTSLSLILKKSALKDREYFIPFAVFSTGFAGMSLNLIVILSFQIFCGFLYHRIALLLTTFMLGLSLGGIIMNRKQDKIKSDIPVFRSLEIILVFFIILVAGTLMILKGMTKNLEFIFFILSCGAGILVGLEFPLANKIYLKRRNGAGTLYALDLLGASFAAISVSIMFIPVLGIINTLFLILMLKVSSLTLLFMRRIEYAT